MVEVRWTGVIISTQKVQYYLHIIGIIKWHFLAPVQCFNHGVLLYPIAFIYQKAQVTKYPKRSNEPIVNLPLQTCQYKKTQISDYCLPLLNIVKCNVLFVLFCLLDLFSTFLRYFNTEWKQRDRRERGDMQCQCLVLFCFHSFLLAFDLFFSLHH